MGLFSNKKAQADGFSFAVDEVYALKEGKTYRMTSFEDGINAGRQAMDYRKKERTLKKGEKISIRLVRNGGFAAVIE